ncbi:hypothetical protein VIK251_00017 [Klebsiella phage vB_KpnM_VIK251]|nr:hypothetical protein VIK251_00017 [Klebsiella phage vB_KpnM_VIK251]
MAIINAPTLFELATRQKLRFASPKGLLTTEDLWDLPMTGNTSLDTVSKLANRDVKVSAEESFVVDATPVNDIAVLKLDVLKHIIAVRKAEQAARMAAQEKADRRRKLLDLLAEKDNEKDAAMSREEILKELESL